MAPVIIQSMSAHLSPRLLKCLQCLALIAVSTLVFALQPSSASASGNLSSIILSNALPGFVQVPAGADNGPIGPASIDTVFAGDSAAQRADITQMLAVGQLSGYVRVWHSEPLVGDGLVEFAFQSPSTESLGLLLGGFEKGEVAAMKENHGSTFGVPGVVDAQGFKIDLANNSPPLQEFVVGFARGNSAFLLTLVTTKYDLTEANLISLAQRQWAKTPGIAIAPQTLPSVGEDLLWGVIVALVVAGIGALWQRQRTRRVVRDNPAIDVTRYATYKHLAKDQRKVVRKSLVKLRLNADDHLNDAALAWADHNLAIYWVTLASFVALDLTVVIVSKGHVYLVSVLAIAMLISALNLRRKRRRFIELQEKYAELVALRASPSIDDVPTTD
jgi:hypothetical protein